MRAVPDDFATVCREMPVRQMIPHYKASQHTIAQWFERVGINPADVRQYNRQIDNRRPRPDDFLDMAPWMTRAELENHYHAGTSTVMRWISEIGGKPRKGAAGKENARTKAVPDDFRQNAHRKNEELREIYGCSPAMLARWRRECGIEPPKFTKQKMQAPDDFAKLSGKMDTIALAERLHVSKATILRWRKEHGIGRKTHPVDRSSTGGRRISFNRPGTPTAPHAPRDDSEAGQAADFMKRRGWINVFRMNDRGEPDQRGARFQCGRLVLTPAEIIEKASAKGFAPARFWGVAA